MGLYVPSINCLTKSELRTVVRNGTPVVLYDPVLGMPAVTGRVRVSGPWEPDHLRSSPMVGWLGPKVKEPNRAKRQSAWHAYCTVKDMKVTGVD